MEALYVSSTSIRAYQSSGGNQGSQPKSLAQLVDTMQSAVDDASQSGKLTDAQAALFKKILEKLAQMLGKSPKDSSDGTDATNAVSADDRQTIKKELAKMRQQLFAAIQAQKDGSGDQIDGLFKAIDGNKDGSINKSELSSFMEHGSSGSTNSWPVSSDQVASQPQTAGYTQQRSMAVSISIYQSRFAVMA